ncbi:MAG: TAT-variant-translocated molybdopterin oxidoreductase, partial [Myxococcota bacterium]
MTEEIYWRSLREFEGDPAVEEFVEREFPAAALNGEGRLGRRRFMQLMGASVGLATGATGCRWEKENILPHTRRPETHVPGRSKRYRTAYEQDGHAIGVEVISFDYRPVKIEGNVDHPFSSGGTDTYAQASVLQFYDPDRSKEYVKGKLQARELATRDAFVEHLRAIHAAAKASGGSALRILAESTSSPTMARVKAQLLEALPQAKVVEYNSVSLDEESAGIEKTFGKRLRPRFDLA